MPLFPGDEIGDDIADELAREAERNGFEVRANSVSNATSPHQSWKIAMLLKKGKGK